MHRFCTGDDLHGWYQLALCRGCYRCTTLEFFLPVAPLMMILKQGQDTSNVLFLWLKATSCLQKDPRLEPSIAVIAFYAEHCTLVQRQHSSPMRRVGVALWAVPCSPVFNDWQRACSLTPPGKHLVQLWADNQATDRPACN